jgi:fructokinase
MKPDREGRLFGGIEGGGTKFICVVASSPDDIRAEARFLTADPDETLAEVSGFFKAYLDTQGPLAGIGLACFGPLDLHPDSPTFGHIMSTPKPGWSGLDVLGRMRDTLDLPVAFESDVNAAVMGERRWGAGRGFDSLIYMTVGTGIGGGGLVNGMPVHGLVHPEMGHLLIRHDLERDPVAGCCPFHGDCLEGLASGPAMAQRWGKPPEELPAGHPAWELEAHYLAEGLANLALSLSPQRIILGGGVMKQGQLFPLIRSGVQQLLAGYVSSALILERIEEYIVPAALGERSGALGAISLAEGLAQ